MFNYFKKFFLILLFLGTLPPAYAMENKPATFGSFYVKSQPFHERLGDFAKTWAPFYTVAFATYLALPYLKRKINEYDYTIHGSFRRIMKTGNFSPENSQIIENYFSKGHRADIIIGNDGKTPLHFAAEHGNLSLVNSLLIQPNVDVNALDMHSQTPLHFAYKSLEKNPQTFNNQIINSLLKHNANPDIVLNKNDETPLTIATQCGNYDLVASLVEKGAQVNIADHNKKTPLHFAFEPLLLPENHAKFNSKIAEKLLEHKANHNILIGNNLETPLTLALKYSKYSLVNNLLKNNAAVDIRNERGETPFSIIINNILQEKDGQKQETNYTIFGNLLAHGINIDAPITVCGKTALILAVEKENIGLVNFLLENNADVSISSKNGYEKERETAIRVATEKILNSKSPEQLTVSYTILAKLLDYRKKDETEKYFTVNYSKNPLIESINKKDFILTNLLLDHKVGINDSDQNTYCDRDNNDTPLIAALREALKTNDPKDIEIVKRLLECGADPDVTIGYYDKTILMWATQYQNLEIVKLLLKNKAGVNKTDKYGKTSLYFAYGMYETAKKSGKIIKQIKIIELIEKLLQQGASPNIRIGNNDHETPLIHAISNQDLDTIKLLVENYGADINLPGSYNTPLSEVACHYNHQMAVQIAKYLLQKGANPNSMVNRYPLIRAIQRQNLDMVKLLVENKADVNASDGYNQTPLSFAIETNNNQIVKYLLQQGAEPNSNNQFDKRLLIEAIEKENLEMVKLLLKYGANINASFFYEDTLLDKDIPLFVAVKTGNSKIVELLLQQGAYPSASIKSRQNSLVHAVNFKYLDIIKLLLIYRTDVNVCNFWGDTPLSVAIENDDLEAIKLLCKAEASLVNIRGDNSAFHLAILSALGVGAPRDQSKKCIETLITHARFSPKIVPQDTFAIVTEKYPQIFCKKPKSTIPSVLALLAPKNVNDDNLTKKMYKKLSTISTYKKILFAQVYERVTELKEILFFPDNQKQTALPLLQTNYKHDPAYIKEMEPLLDGTKLDADFKKLVEALTKISKSDTNNLKEFLSLLDSTLNNPDNLALQMYKNCALPED